MKKLVLAFLTLTSAMPVVVAAAPAPKQPLAAHDAWVLAVPPSASTSAAYMIIENASDKPVVLESARASVAKQAELHEMGHSKGMMTMKMIGSLTIPAHGRAVLAPGGAHIMLIGLKKPLKPGDRVRLTLTCRGNRRLTVVAPVREAASDGGMKMDGAKMGMGGR